MYIRTQRALAVGVSVQYSVEEGQKKGDLQFKNTSGILLVVLMKESPKVFKKFKSERYIHRFKTMTADSGFAYVPMETVIYVQLDKCLQQFLEGKDGEGNGELQLLLSAMADINNTKVLEASKDNPFMKDIYMEVKNMSERKEVQAMLLAEKYAEADLNAVRHYEREEGREEGVEELAQAILLVRSGCSTMEALEEKGISRAIAEMALKLA